MGGICRNVVSLRGWESILYSMTISLYLLWQLQQGTPFGGFLHGAGWNLNY